MANLQKGRCFIIIARSPLRISFAGGGTDIPGFYRKHGPGAVVSTSIDKYVYVTVKQKFNGGVSLRYNIHENKKVASELDHFLVRKALEYYGIETGVEIVIISDVPANGSGLGASSAMTCALVAALSKFSAGVDVTNDKGIIANVACAIEIDMVGSPIGKQDQYASAFGGLNFFKFFNDGLVNVKSFESQDFIKELESQSMLFYLNIEHTYFNEKANRTLPNTQFTPKILREQIEQIESMKSAYILQRDNAINLWEHLAYEVPERFIDHINENWRIKRGMHNEISSDAIDEIIQRAYKAGATAAKVCGAGGGGFVYLVVPPSMQDNVREELKELPELHFKFENKGTEIIFDSQEEKLETVNH